MVMPPRGLFIVLQKVVHRRFVDVISRIAVFFFRYLNVHF